MPIRIDRFEDEDAPEERPVSQRVLGFLVENTDQAYTRTEIAESIDVDPETDGTAPG